MSNEVLIVVRSEERTDPGFNAARAKGKKLGADLEADAKQSSKKMGQAYGDGIGAGLNMAASDAAPKLSAKLVPAAKEAGEQAGEKLGAGLAKGVDDSLRDAKGKFVSAGEGLGETLGDGAGSAFEKSSQRWFSKAGSKIGEVLSRDSLKSFMDGFSGGKERLVPIAAAVGATMAPMIGGALAAAVVGAGGLTGIAGGLLVASKDPAVKAAGESLKEQIGGDLKKAATDFVPAAVQGIGQVRAAWKSILPDVKAIFSGSATLLGPFLDGVIDGTKSIVRGIRAAVEQGEPVIESLGRLFANVGDSVGRMFEGFADNADESASALDDLTDALTKTLDATAGLINGLTEIHGGLDTVDAAIDEERYRWERLIPFLDATADGYEKNSTAAELYRQGVIGAAGSTNDYAAYTSKLAEEQRAAEKATNDQTSALKALADEMKAQTDPLFALIDGQSKVAEAQTAHNKAVDKFGKNSPEAREAMTKLGKAAFDLADKAGEAAGGFNGKLTPAMRTALRNAGLTAPQINKLEQELKQAAAAARRWEGTYSQTYETHFKQFGKPYSKEGVERGQVGGLEHGGIKGAASGMLASGLTWVGEAGPELISLPPGAAVRSNPDSMRAVAQGGNGMGADRPVVIVLQVDGQTIARTTLPSLQHINRTEYAGDVSRMFPATR